MENRWEIAVLGDDRRQTLLAELLAADGHTVHRIQDDGALPRLERTELVIFPLPACREDGAVSEGGPAASGVLARMAPGSIAFGGRVSKTLTAQARARGIPFCDYTLREDFAIANALATAEGALGIALTQTEGTLQGADCLVIGNGRIGKLLARKLALLGGRVTVSARRAEDLAWIVSDGHTAMRTDRVPAAADRFDLICNTVPAPVLDADALGRARPSALIVDLASAPGGVDLDAAQALGLHAVRALALPARTAPRAAAGYVRDSIYRGMEEHTHA